MGGKSRCINWLGLAPIKDDMETVSVSMTIKAKDNATIPLLKAQISMWKIFGWKRFLSFSFWKAKFKLWKYEGQHLTVPLAKLRRKLMSILPPECNCRAIKLMDTPCPLHGYLNKPKEKISVDDLKDGLQVGTSDGLSCPTMEDCQYVQWVAGDKTLLAAALKEIYNIRGEDEEIAKIVNDALDRGNAT